MFNSFTLKQLLSVCLAMVLFIVTPQSLFASPKPLSDDELLDRIQQYSLRFFLSERDEKTGLIYDQALNFESSGENKSLASIAATGFGLVAYGVGVERGWLTLQEAQKMTLQVLDTFLNRTPHERGFFYHFLNARTAQRGADSELSPIDTAILLGGVLFAGEYYDHPQIKEMAKRIYERVDWPWMLNGGKTFALAWSPERGFDSRRWDHYSELLMMYLLAIGSPTYPVSAKTWHAFRRPAGSYGDYRLIYLPPLFVHQYSHIWIDFRNKHDDYADYFQNSVKASLASRAFSMDQAARYMSYGENSWGLTASDGPAGYRAYGAPPGFVYHDGTLAPTGCGSSIVFTPTESLACLRHYYEKLHDRLWGRYGFSDAFNLDKNWVSPRVLGIDQGPLLLMIENYRSGLVWKTMNQQAFLKTAMEKAGFREGTKEISWPTAPEYEAVYVSGGIEVDSYAKDWPSGTEKPIRLDASKTESGKIDGSKDLKAQVRLAWNEDGLYFYADVSDDSVIYKYRKGQIWRNDLLELFIDPQGDGLQWGGAKDFQLGFSPSEHEDGVASWAWFGLNQDPTVTGDMTVKGFLHEKGYSLEGRIGWRFLGIQPFPGQKMKLSISVHDIDRDKSEAKVQWFFRPAGGFEEFETGSILLIREKNPGEELLDKSRL